MVTLTHNKQHYKNVRHQATRRAQIWLIQLRHLDAIQVLFISVANESPVYFQMAYVEHSIPYWLLIEIVSKV